MKLWQNPPAAAAPPDPLTSRVEQFTAGSDPRLDLELLPWDCLASKAHARMLAHTGLLTQEEAGLLIEGLDEIIVLHRWGEFRISMADEDGHTAIENFLVQRCGEAGKKIHTGRSRNDQVLTALRLYCKERAGACATATQGIIAALEALIATRGSIPLPGYTHTRKAMPASVEMWAGAWRDAFSEDLELLGHAAVLIDQNPLGTGAGYGVPLPLDREMTTAELGFSRVMANPLHAQNSRGKYEGILLHALAVTLADLNRMATDLILYTMPGFDYFTLPAVFMTGSSIMPQKQNPDVLELLRARYHEVAACEAQLRAATVNLISGYHRDLQSTKEPLLRGLGAALDALEMAGLVVQNLEVNAEACQAAMTGELYATAQAYELLKEGIPFREAYRIVAARFRKEERE